MSKEFLVTYLHREAELESRAEAERVYEAVVEAVTTELTQGGEVHLRGFGSLTVKERKARKGRNPQTGEAMDIPAAKAVKFTPGKELKELVNQEDVSELLAKMEFSKAMDVGLKEAREAVNELGKRADKLSGEARSVMHDAVESLSAKYDDVRARWRNYRAHSGDAWVELRKGIEGAYDELKDGIKRARAKL